MLITSDIINFNNITVFSFYKALLFLCFSLVSAPKPKAQTIPIADPKLDTSYVQLDYDTWSLRAFGVIKYHNFVLSNQSGEKIKYTPINPFSVGLGFAYRFIIMDAGFRLNKDNRLTRFDFNANLVFNKNMFEILLQRYEGFEGTIGTSTEYFREDIRSTLFNINQFYNFNNKKLSLGSTLSGNKIQQRSTGTFILGGYFSYSKIEADWSLVPSSREKDFNKEADFTEYSAINIGAYFGYAYSLVLYEKYILFTSVSPGIGLNFANVKGIENYKPPIFPVGKLHFIASIGYYTKRIYIIMALSTNLFITSLGNENRLKQNAGQIKLAFGYRIYSKNPLTKTIDKAF